MFETRAILALIVAILGIFYSWRAGYKWGEFNIIVKVGYVVGLPTITAFYVWLIVPATKSPIEPIIFAIGIEVLIATVTATAVATQNPRS